MSKLNRYSNFVETRALKSYQEELGVNNFVMGKIISDKIGRLCTNHHISYWRSRGIAPKEVLKVLEIKTRLIPRVRSSKLSKTKSGGDLYVCYINSQEREAFLAFCSAMKIEAKSVL